MKGLLRLIILAGILALPVVRTPAVEFSFTVSIDDLGTVESKKDQLPDGTPFSYPIDEADLAELLKPMLTAFRNDRKGAPEFEIKEVFNALNDSGERAKLILLARALLDSKEISKDFYDHLDQRMEEVKLILNQWVYYSSDISEARLWNRRQLADRIDQKTRVITFDGYSMTIPSADGGNTFKWDLTVLPPFVSDGMGLDVSRLEHSARKFPLDIPIIAVPGVPAKESADFTEEQIATLTQLMGNFGKQGLFNISRVFLLEAIIQHEIKNRWLPEAETQESLAVLNTLTRYAFASEMSRLDSNSTPESILKSCLYFKPESQDIPAFAKAIAELNVRKPAPDAAPDHQKAGAYLLALAMHIGDADKPTSEPKWSLFRALPEEKVSSPAQLFKILDRRYPDLDKHIAKAKAAFDTVLRERHPLAFPPGPPAEPVPDSKPPENYLTETFDQLTIQYPDSLKEAVAVVGPQWANATKKGRDAYIDAVKQRPFLEVQYLTEVERNRFTAFGLETADKEIVDEYADLLWTMAEADRVFYRLFPDHIGVWIKEDLVELLKNGGSLTGFIYNDDGVTFTFDLEQGMFKGLSIDELKEKFYVMPPIPLPSVLKADEIDGKNKDELVEALQKSSAAGALLSTELSVDELAAALGKRPLGFTDVETFFVMVHEHAELSIVRTTIGSPYRRWFTDGLANYIAAEMTDERFGDGAGWKVVENKFPIADENLDEVRANLDLLNWRATEHESLAERSPDQLSNARYKFASYAIKKAVGDRGDKFIHQWLDEIRKTPWNRANSTHVIAAYDKLTGEDLKTIVEEIGQ